jgi:hypothetical protein
MHWTNLVHWWLATPTTELIWIGIGLTAQLLFSMRFLVQWVATEKARASTIPETFWYFSFRPLSPMLIGLTRCCLAKTGLGSTRATLISSARQARACSGQLV